ncbi:MAG TPA: hypothetical protein VMU15_21705 [Anaeromyxobacter sp.]|nr:hypothetical protein [Anaeromyxobacter sp.]
MRVIAIEKAVPGVKEEAFTPPVLREEAARAWELYQAGELRELHFRADREEAVLFLEVPDLPAARAVLARLPLVQRGLIDFELVPLAPYPGFARLFSGG